MKRQHSILTMIVCTACTLAGVGSAAQGALLQVVFGAPTIDYNSNGQTTFDATSGQFNVDAKPLACAAHLTFAARAQGDSEDRRVVRVMDERGAVIALASASLPVTSAWRLYDLDVLRANTVPVAAAVYLDDMYVESAYSQETAAFIPGVRAWVTNEYEHNALRGDGEKLLDRLLGMARGSW